MTNPHAVTRKLLKKIHTTLCSVLTLSSDEASVFAKTIETCDNLLRKEPPPYYLQD